MNFQRFFWLVLFAGLLAPTPLLAQQAQPAPSAPSLPVMVLNLEQIRQKSLAVQDIRKQIGGFREGYQKGIEKEEKALRAANQELAKKRSILSPEAFAKERRQFEQRVVGVQKLVEKRKRQLDTARVTAMRVVEGKLNTIITNLAESRGALLVLRRSQTFMVARELDGTAEVLTQLNKELVKVPVKKPSD